MYIMDTGGEGGMKPEITITISRADAEMLWRLLCSTDQYPDVVEALADALNANQGNARAKP